MEHSFFDLLSHLLKNGGRGLVVEQLKRIRNQEMFAMIFGTQNDQQKYSKILEIMKSDEVWFPRLVKLGGQAETIMDESVISDFEHRVYRRSMMSFIMGAIGESLYRFTQTAYILTDAEGKYMGVRDYDTGASFNTELGFWNFTSNYIGYIVYEGERLVNVFSTQRDARKPMWLVVDDNLKKIISTQFDRPQQEKLYFANLDFKDDTYTVKLYDEPRRGATKFIEEVLKKKNIEKDFTFEPVPSYRVTYDAKNGYVVKSNRWNLKIGKSSRWEIVIREFDGNNKDVRFSVLVLGYGSGGEQKNYTPFKWKFSGIKESDYSVKEIVAHNAELWCKPNHSDYQRITLFFGNNAYRIKNILLKSYNRYGVSIEKCEVKTATIDEFNMIQTRICASCSTIGTTNKMYECGNLCETYYCGEQCADADWVETHNQDCEK